MALAAKGYTVLATSSPEDAENACVRHGAEIHLLLTDLIMPGITGRELAKRLTARHPKMRLLYMSGYTFGITTQAGMEGGVVGKGVGVLPKPLKPRAAREKGGEGVGRGVRGRKRPDGIG